MKEATSVIMASIRAAFPSVRNRVEAIGTSKKTAKWKRLHLLPGMHVAMTINTVFAVRMLHTCHVCAIRLK